MLYPLTQSNSLKPLNAQGVSETLQQNTSISTKKTKHSCRENRVHDYISPIPTYYIANNIINHWPHVTQPPTHPQLTSNPRSLLLLTYTTPPPSHYRPSHSLLTQPAALTRSLIFHRNCPISPPWPDDDLPTLLYLVSTLQPTNHPVVKLLLSPIVTSRGVRT